MKLNTQDIERWEWIS